MIFQNNSKVLKGLRLCLLLTGFITGGMYAQEQKRKVLLQQIAALKVYIGYAQKGYSITRAGLNATRDFKRGEFTLHADYLNALKKVSPEIKKDYRVAEIIVLQVKILSSCKGTYADFRDDDLFHAKERSYIKRVFDRLRDDCTAHLDELIAVTMDGALEMKDDERIKRMDRLYFSLLDMYSFCQRFNNQIKLLHLERAKEGKEIQTGRTLYGILND